jgi:hypothetical protein
LLLFVAFADGLEEQTGVGGSQFWQTTMRFQSIRWPAVGDV